MGDIAIGDSIFDEAGRVCCVTAKFSPKVDEQYRLTFSDGAQIDACADHQWVTWTHAERKSFLRSPYEDASRFPADWPKWRLKRRLGKVGLGDAAISAALELHRTGHSVRAIARLTGYCRQALVKHISAGRYVIRAPVVHDNAPGPRIRTTREIVETLCYGKSGNTNHCIPCCAPLDLPDAKLPIPPYTFGVWLGDGDSNGGSVTAHEDDAPFTRRQIEADGFLTTDRKDQQQFGVLGLQIRLRFLDVLKNKHVPGVYLRASIQQRLALLRGLMDTDGNIEQTNTVAFVNTNKRLVDAVQELVHSLGMKTRVWSGVGTCNGTQGKQFWRVQFTPTVNPFTLPRKANALTLGGSQSLRNHHRMIVAAERIAPVPMSCITVDSPNSMYLAGREMIPTHNTRVEMEDAFWYGATHPNERIGLIAATYADARDTMVEGSSGLLSIVPAPCLFAWNRSLGELILWNGTRYKLFAATEPERLRGPQHSRLYCDELAAWEYPETWDQAMFGLRLGQRPRTIIATTPKPTPLIRRIFADPHTHVTSGSTFDNAANLAPSALANLKAKYEGTRLGRQELNAEILDDVPGALWTRVMIDAARARRALPDMARIVVAIDPSGARDASDEEADSIGIVVAGKGVDGRGYVLADRSCKLSPAAWGARAVDAYREFAADAIVAERNFGGAMVEHVIRTADPQAPYREVVASRGKVVRAEPVSALYEQGLISHIGLMPELEDQMCNMGTAGYVGDGSPDRLDAAVWALTELMLKDPHGTQIIHADKLLLDGAPRDALSHCQFIFVTVSTHLKTGKPENAIAAVWWAMDEKSHWPLTVLDWDITPLEGDWANRWLPSLIDKAEEFARSYNAHFGVGGLWAEKRGAGVIVIEQARRRGVPAHEIDTDLTKMGAQEKAASVSGYVAVDKIKLLRPAYDRSCMYRGVERNHLLGQLSSIRLGAKEDQPEQELLTAFLDGVMIACGSRRGW